MFHIFGLVAGSVFSFDLLERSVEFRINGGCLYIKLSRYRSDRWLGSKDVKLISPGFI